MIAHMNRKAFDDLDFTEFPVGTKLEVDENVQHPFISLEQHEIDQCPDEIPES